MLPPALSCVYPLTEPEIAQKKEHNNNNTDDIEDIHTTLLVSGNRWGALSHGVCPLTPRCRQRTGAP